MIDLKAFFERYKGVRRTVLAFCIAWTTTALTIGGIAILTGAMTAPASAFLTAVVLLMEVPIGFYFWARGQGK